MNRYYIEMQNKLTDRIRVTIAEMNNNVFELSEENKQLQQRIDKVNEILYDDNLCHIEKLQEIHKILGDKENERSNT